MKLTFMFLIALGLSVQARHVGNRFRRADNNNGNPNEKTDVGNNRNNADFWLKNWVVGPPIGAPHITLDVNRNFDDDIANVLKNLDANKKEDQEKENRQTANTSVQNDKKNKEDTKLKGSSLQIEKSKSAEIKSQANGGDIPNTRKSNQVANAQINESKTNLQDSTKPTSVADNFKSTAKNNAHDGQANKKPDNNRNSNGAARGNKKAIDFELDEYSF